MDSRTERGSGTGGASQTGNQEIGAQRGQTGRSPDSGTPHAGTLLDLESFLPYRLHLLNETVSRSLSRVYGREYGFGVPEWRVLVTLGQYGEMTAKQIGAHSQMHKTKVSRAAAALSAKDLLARMPAEHDRRAAKLSLSARGRAVYEDLVPVALGFSAQLESVLSASDRAALDRLLNRLKARAEEISDALANGAGEFNAD
ncbi:MAG TPA: MarR family winged helix-turn-helix transcriptional regulator [Hyphomicrobiales bacterium]|nr:winged helix-turn-helix transcriptional regulator [Rhodobiaceae bacterium]HXK53143.1 MarR family winged helix-turn-helix transcriptional regulator [Hyphomicrobiales bacterium]